MFTSLLRGKHCQYPIAVMVVVDMFGQYVIDPISQPHPISDGSAPHYSRAELGEGLELESCHAGLKMAFI